MFGIIARLVGGALSPIVDQVSEFGAGLLRKLALFLVAGVSLVVVAIALTVAFDLWIASLAGAIVGALAVAGLYAIVAGGCLYLALRKAAPTKQAAGKKTGAETTRSADAERAPRGAQIDQFTAPILAILQSLGLRREQLAVLAGGSVAKQLRPIPLVGIAIVAGFLVGRMYKGWRSFLSLDAMTAILSSGLFGGLAAGNEDGAA